MQLSMKLPKIVLCPFCAFLGYGDGACSLLCFSLSFLVFCFNREMKCEGIQGIRRLAKHHPEVLSLHLHTVTLAIIAEVSNDD